MRTAAASALLDDRFLTSTNTFHRTTTAVNRVSGENLVALNLLGQLPPAAERKRDETVLKMNPAAEWERHRLILSNKSIFMCHVGAATISDQIPLVSPLIFHFFV